MKVRAISIDNCKSYRERGELALDREITLLVGPNGGGKSNTMDILSIVLRKFFLQTFTLNEGRDSGILFQDIQQQKLFHPTSKFLDKNSEREGDETDIQLVLEVGKTDVSNVAMIIENRARLEQAFGNYRNRPVATLAFLDSWTPGMFQEGQTFNFTIRDDDAKTDDPVGRKFREYLVYLNLFMLLARDLPDIDLSPTFLYFSPYRSAAPEDLNATLASDNYFNLLHSSFGTTSRNTTSLIKLATVHFAEKLRRLEVHSRESPYGDAWAEDRDVVLASRYLKRLGYTWDLRLVDRNKNTYEIVLERAGREFLITNASSGEKEILNFLFGILALRTRGGLLVVDEPELHLHPRWQAILRDLFLELATATDNQFLVSTHSPVFITPATIDSVLRIAKDDTGSTKLVGLGEHPDHGDARSLLHIVNSHNNERIFFADKVVLVEGVQDRIVFDALISRYREASQINEVVEVVEVHGKSSFSRYRRFLEAFRIPHQVIADLDYGVDVRRGELGDLVTTPYEQIDEKVLKAKKSQDRYALSESLSRAVTGGDLEYLREVWQYIEGRFVRLKDELSAEEERRLQKALDALRAEGIIVLGRGEIEDYLPEEHRTVDGTIELLEPDSLLKWIKEIPHNNRVGELERIVTNVLGVPEGQAEEIRISVCNKLREEIQDREDEGTNGEMTQSMKSHGKVEVES